MIAYAAPAAHVAAAQSMLARIEDVILFPLMTLMIAVAVLIFFYGMFQYVQNADSESGRETGKQHMLYGIIGFLIMVSALGILKIAAGTFGVDVPN